VLRSGLPLPWCLAYQPVVEMPGRRTLAENVKNLRAETLEQVNRDLLPDAKAEGVKKGRKVSDRRESSRGSRFASSRLAAVLAFRTASIRRFARFVCRSRVHSHTAPSASSSDRAISATPSKTR
jgi:hypothetical protein